MKIRSRSVVNSNRAHRLSGSIYRVFVSYLFPETWEIVCPCDKRGMPPKNARKHLREVDSHYIGKKREICKMRFEAVPL